MAAIEIQNVEKRVGTFTLGPVSLTIPRGTIYGLIGPNGAGKTTMLDLLMRMGDPDQGSIQVLGRDVVQDEVDIKLRTAYVSPDLNYQVWGTVGRAIHFISGFYPDWDQQRCERLQAELAVHSSEKIATLSFGARMKLALIMALSRGAELLLLDEPTLGLDAISRRQLFTELLAFMQNEDRTILISSHQLSDLERFADHAAVIANGRILTTGRMDELVERFRQVHVRANNALNRKIPGLHIMSRASDHAVLVVDTQTVSVHALAALGIEVIGETSLTLEEIFIALVGPSAQQGSPEHAP
jgi:ABC-2 type transport system ATP-binding protein